MSNTTILSICALGFAISAQGFVVADELKDSELPLTAAAPYIEDGSRNQNPADGKLKGQTLRIKRVLFMVKDLQQSLVFYENVIGLEVYAVDQFYSLDQTTIGNELFNTPEGTRRRIATLNTSSEVRGLALREIDADFEVSQMPRLSTVLFEASDILTIFDRAKHAGAKTIGPHLAIIPPRGGASELRVMELGIVDPDGHIVTFFKYYSDSDEDQAKWADARERYKTDLEP